jgi:glycosyltransferase involved in cell wall biosynthesis
MVYPLKILHYIPTYAPAWKYGGPILSVSQLCECLAQLGHHVEVFTSTAGLEYDRDIQPNQPTYRNGVTVTYFEQTPGVGIHCPAMENAVQQRAQNFDLIHVTGVWQRTSYAACQAAKQFGIPYVVSPRGALGPYSWGQKTPKKAVYYLWHERFNVMNAAGVHYTTQQELEECRWLGLPGRPIIVPNGLDTNAWQPDPEGAKHWRQAHGLTPDEVILLNVGRLHHKKGLDLLPAALAPLKGQPWKLVFVGGDDDDTKKQLQTQFQRSQLTEHVLFLQACQPDQLPAVYSAANLFVLPSRHENFGNVVVEALACGCPVLISDRVGLHREVSAAGTGWVLPRQPQAWAQTLQMLLQQPEQLRATAGRARPWVEAEFAIRQTALQMAEHYSQVIHKVEEKCNV